MFPLMKLPNELILRVIDEVLPGDIEVTYVFSDLELLLKINAHPRSEC